MPHFDGQRFWASVFRHMSIRDFLEVKRVLRTTNRLEVPVEVMLQVPEQFRALGVRDEIGGPSEEGDS